MHSSICYAFYQAGIWRFSYESPKTHHLLGDGGVKVTSMFHICFSMEMSIVTQKVDVIEVGSSIKVTSAMHLLQWRYLVIH